MPVHERLLSFGEGLAEFLPGRIQQEVGSLFTTDPRFTTEEFRAEPLAGFKVPGALETLAAFPGSPGLVLRGTTSLAGRAGMGFLSSLTGFIGRVATGVGRFLGVVPPAAVAGAGLAAGAVAARVAPRAVGRLLPGAIGAVAGATGALAGTALLAPDDGTGAMVGGNGMTTVQTIVNTIDNATGQIIRQRVLRGRPFLMQRDFVAWRRVERMARTAARRVGLKARKPSQKTVLRNAFETVSLQRALTSAASCPA